MPVVRATRQSFPDWSELHRFDIHSFKSNQVSTLMWTSTEFKVVCVRGSCKVDDVPETVMQAGSVWNASRGFPLAENRWIRVSAIEDDTKIVTLEGTWGEETGGCGVFGVVNVDAPVNPGDAVEYERNTSFDNHFHDCDEFWIVVEGEGVAVSEGVSFHVAPGDCVVTGAGDHHDVPTVMSPIRAVFFETTLLGKKRLGHLWEHTHGPAIPIRRETSRWRNAT